MNLENGNMIVKCLICKGTGKRWKLSRYPREQKTVYSQFECVYCNGIGYKEVDWIEAAINKSKVSYIMRGLSFDITRRSLQAKTRKIKAGWTLGHDTNMKMCMSDEVVKELDKAIVDSISVKKMMSI